jgi:hypothetical protein
VEDEVWKEAIQIRRYLAMAGEVRGAMLFLLSGSRLCSAIYVVKY